MIVSTNIARKYLNRVNVLFNLNLPVQINAQLNGHKL
jgi:hypothetical protein